MSTKTMQGIPDTWTDNPPIKGRGKYGLVWSRFHQTSRPGTGVVEQINLFRTKADRDNYMQTVHAKSRAYAKDIHLQPFETLRSTPNDTDQEADNQGNRT